MEPLMSQLFAANCTSLPCTSRIKPRRSHVRLAVHAACDATGKTRASALSTAASNRSSCSRSSMPAAPLTPLHVASAVGNALAVAALLMLLEQLLLRRGSSPTIRLPAAAAIAGAVLYLPHILRQHPGLGVLAGAASITTAAKILSAALYTQEMPCLKAGWFPGALILACAKDCWQPHTLVPRPSRAQQVPEKTPASSQFAWQPAPPVVTQVIAALRWCLVYDVLCELLLRLWPQGQLGSKGQLGLLAASVLLGMAQWVQFAMGHHMLCLSITLHHRAALLLLRLLRLPLPSFLATGPLLLPPPGVTSPWHSTSLQDLWGKRWHQYFRSDHYNLAQRPTQAALDWAGSRLGTGVTASPHWRNIRRAVTVMAVFVFSGLFHEYMNWAGLGISDGMHLAFFTVHGLGLLLEEKLAAPGKDVDPAVLQARRAALLCFLVATSPLFALPWLQAGYHLQLLRPLHIVGPVLDIAFRR
ncbi:hypothetical protein QJQ45_011964 [Haematococcus lacustris]|nr:hypothetical protein QJQ45_011964 [Haematococcus lacustris]